MKKITQILAVLFLSIGGAAVAQNSTDGIPIPLSNPGTIGTLDVSIIAGSITVQGYTGKDVLVKINSEKDDTPVEKRADGMKRLNVSGGDYDIKESSNVVTVRGNGGSETTSLLISVPSNFNLKLHTVNDGEILVKGVTGEIEAENVNGGITLDNISGSVSSNTVNGDVVVTLNAVNPGSPLAFSTLNGDVDVTVPATFKGNAKFKSEQGEIFTDFDIDVSKNNGNVQTSKDGGVYKVKIENWVEGTINGGGPQILMKNMNGDIYLRKKK